MMVDACILGGWWLTRGIELAAARACHMWTDHETATVSWSLPVSKTDVKGMCATRTHGCCCKKSREPICPYHTAVRHLRRLRITFGHNWNSADRDIPLFPNRDENYLSHTETIKYIRDVIGQTGEALTRPGVNGKPLQRFAEHVLRVSGAQMMARGGMDLYFIQLMGRWGSNAIERYVQDAYLLDQQNIAMAVTDKIDTRASQDRSENTSKPSVSPMLSSATEVSLQQDIENIKMALQSLKIQVETKTLILNTKSGLLHIPNICENGTPNSTWRTKCGWGYGHQVFCRVTCLPVGATRCSKCWKHEDSPDTGTTEPEAEENSDSSAEDSD